jgi:hypothetical protein
MVTCLLGVVHEAQVLSLHVPVSQFLEGWDRVAKAVREQMGVGEQMGEGVGADVGVGAGVGVVVFTCVILNMSFLHELICRMRFCWKSINRYLQSLMDFRLLDLAG